MLKALKNIPSRAKKAMYYSLCGLGASFKKEEAIKLETLSLVILVIIMCFVPWPFWKKITLIASFLLIPLVELINSSIEDICDLVSMEYNEKIKTSKDKGSAAVLMAIIINILVLIVLWKVP
ncbi:MAG: diacylglycerol kinase [Deltaproteobacteria bacterium]|jgi:diacylglycerol kinase (ATP)|nr:diacylglycerol kinase [Deltaproteobacteria bacterium]